MKRAETALPGKRLHARRFPAGFVSHLLGSFRRSIDNARDATSRLCQVSAVVSLAALAGWTGGLMILARGHSVSGPLSPPAALCFLLLALALHNHNQDPLSGRTRTILVLTALFVPYLATLNAAGFLNLMFAQGSGAAAQERIWSNWAGVDPYSWVNLTCLSLAMALCPLFARRRQLRGDVLGALVLFMVLFNGIFIFGYMHKVPISLFRSGNGSAPFLGCVNMVLLGLAVLGRLGPRHFPLRFLSGSSVRAVILRHFLPVAAAAVLVFDVLNVASYESVHLALSSFLVLLLSLVAVVYLSLRSAEVIGRRIESSLRESEDRYAVLVESLKDHGVLLLDPAGCILTWNAGAERIQGWGADDVLGDPVSRFYPPEERENGKMEQVFKAATLRGSHEEQGRRVGKDGSLFWAETVTTPFLDDKNVLLGFSQVFRDITLRKKAEEVVRERESFMQLLQSVTAACNGAGSVEDALSLVLNQVCLHTRWPVGHAWLPPPDRDVFVSGPWHLSEPVRFADFRARSDRLRFPPDPGLPAHVLASEESYWAPDMPKEKESLRKDVAQEAGLRAGYAFPVKLNGKTMAVLEFFSERSEDLSASWRKALEAVCLQVERLIERDRAEQSLRGSEWRFRSLTQTANDAIVSYDGAGKISGWNRGAKAIFGYDEAEILGGSLARIVPEPPPTLAGGPVRGDAVWAGFPQAFLADMAGKTFRLSGVRKGGEAFPFEASVATWMSGGSVYFTAIMRDVTASKQAQDTLTASLREKEALLKEIHHRVKNNLQMISSLLRLQSEKIQDPALLSIFLESQTRVRSMAIVHECLYESPDLASMDFSEYVEKLTDSLFRTYSGLSEKNALRVDVDKVPLSLDVAIPCGLIITELVSNALKYAYPAGREGPVSVTFRASLGHDYELTVADEGVGLKKPVDFESTESLGLRLVHLLTEQLHGRIRVENGVGAKFIVNFKAFAGKS